ncbi:MAG TPA: sulfotransferase domain-containing protein [Gammaproteobacteria bacterium]|nr:sulfotransferase domain-containing protein [Gammaproteobacteria bacterium]
MTKPFSAREQRRPAPGWIRHLSLPLAAVLIWPWTWLFPRGWARMLSRTMTRFLGRFPETYEPAPHDVFICSYFKSGTNWTMQIAVQIAHRGAAAYDHIHDLVPWPETPPRARYAVPLADDRPRAAAPTGLRVIKTHLALDRVPYSPAARYVCVVRDPKDVFVSSYHFIRSHVGFLMPPVWAWLDAYLSPDTALGSWAAHLASYWRARDRSNVLFLTYEQMRGDLGSAVDAVAALMGVELTADERVAVVRQSTFAHMKGIENKFETRGAPWSSASGAMIRRGEQRASGEMLSATDQVRVDDYWRAELARMECDFPYDAAFGVTQVLAAAAPAPAAAR